MHCSKIEYDGNSGEDIIARIALSKRVYLQYCPEEGTGECELYTLQDEIGFPHYLCMGKDH